MSDPVCTSEMHYFRTPLVDGEKCQCGFSEYDSGVHVQVGEHTSESEETDPYAPAKQMLTTWAAMGMFGGGGNSSSGFGGFGGGSSGGAGSSGGW